MMHRREFVKLLGGGIVVLITAKPAELFAQRRGYPEDPNAYLRIDENGKVTIFSGKIEMGQGIHTSLAQMAAEVRQANEALVLAGLREQQLAERATQLCREAQAATRAREDLLAIVSHDLRAPLTTMIMSIDLLRRAPAHMLSAKLTERAPVSKNGGGPHGSRRRARGCGLWVGRSARLLTMRPGETEIRSSARPTSAHPRWR